MKDNFIHELKWRGLLADMTPGIETALAEGVVVGYIGFDPTADSLHIGNLAQLITLKRFQRAGHRPIMLIGSATGMIGDPSGKSAERNLLDEETLSKNATAVANQGLKFFESNIDGDTFSLRTANNKSWMEKMTALDFLRNIGKLASVSQMMARDSVRSRIETGLSFTEFSYQLIQAYDFVHLNKSANCFLQMGGSDQWGNMTAGIDMVRKMNGKEVFAITTNLVTKSDGKKFGKSEEGNVWLDPSKTTPYEFFQFWLKVSDKDVESMLKIFTFLTEVEILQAKMTQFHTPGHMQKLLAQTVTTMVHGAEICESVTNGAKLIFNATQEELQGLSEENIKSACKGFPHHTFQRNVLNTGVRVPELLAFHTKVFNSKGEVNRLMAGGGLSINKQKMNDSSCILTKDLLADKFLIVQKGKGNFILCEAEIN